MANRTPTFALIEDRLGKNLTRYVLAARTPTPTSPKRSWNAIALDLHQKTGVAVTSETLRTWFYDHDTKINPPVDDTVGAA